jgi:hypothetical protein
MEARYDEKSFSPAVSAGGAVTRRPASDSAVRAAETGRGERLFGGVAERLIAPGFKPGGLAGLVGSNPTASARHCARES